MYLRLYLSIYKKNKHKTAAWEHNILRFETFNKKQKKYVQTHLDYTRHKFYSLTKIKKKFFTNSLRTFFKL